MEEGAFVVGEMDVSIYHEDVGEGVYSVLKWRVGWVLLLQSRRLSRCERTSTHLSSTIQVPSMLHIDSTIFRKGLKQLGVPAIQLPSYNSQFLTVIALSI